MSFSKADFSHGAVNQVFLGVFLMFLVFSVVIYGRNFILVLLKFIGGVQKNSGNMQKDLGTRISKIDGEMS